MDELIATLEQHERDYLARLHADLARVQAKIEGFAELMGVKYKTAATDVLHADGRITRPPTSPSA